MKMVSTVVDCDEKCDVTVEIRDVDIADGKGMFYVANEICDGVYRKVKELFEKLSGYGGVVNDKVGMSLVWPNLKISLSKEEEEEEEEEEKKEKNEIGFSFERWIDTDRDKEGIRNVTQFGKKDFWDSPVTVKVRMTDGRWNGAVEIRRHVLQHGTMEVTGDMKSLLTLMKNTGGIAGFGFMQYDCDEISDEVDTKLGELYCVLRGW